MRHEAGEEAAVARLPEKLADKEVLREQVKHAMADLASQKRHRRINLTDPEARLMKGRQGIVAGYNAQAMVSPMETDGGATSMLVTAVDVVDAANDNALLVLMMEQAEAFRACTRAKEIGRSLAIGPHGEVLRRHRSWMSTSAAQEAYKLRKQLVEPAFGIIKEQQGARRFLLRGLVNVAAEWTMLATAFNLRTLYRVWSSCRSFSHPFHGPKPCPVS